MFSDSRKYSTVLFTAFAILILVSSQTIFAQEKKPETTAATAKPMPAQNVPFSPKTPGATVTEFYRLMREKKFSEAFTLSVYKLAVEGLTPEELADLAPDFEALASNIPANIEVTREEISGTRAIVFVRVQDIDDETPKTQPVQLKKDGERWLILSDDSGAEAAVQRDGKNYFFNLRIDTHHAEVESIFRDIIKAEFAYASQNGGRYADLAELIRSGLVTDDLLNTKSTGYKFRVTVSKDGKSYSGGAEPERYGKTGRLSFTLKVNSFDKKDNGGKPY